MVVAKVVKRFLVNKDGCVQSIMMQFLMPKTGGGSTLKETPKYLPPDIGHFSLADIILGPLEVIPRARDSMTFNFAGYDNLKLHYRVVSKPYRTTV